MREQFINKNVGPDKLELIKQAHKIIQEYVAAGYTLTLRQLYYQFVARDLLPNTMKSYKKLGDAISDGRMMGILSWSAIEDRTRGVERNAHWESPQDGIRALRNQYKIDMWANQPTRVEVWIEKEALIGVIEPVCRELDLPYLACRGYVSQSEQWRAYKRFQGTHEAGQSTLILHFGDHDPSGIDMTRDNGDRLSRFLSTKQELAFIHDQKCLEVRRMALTIEQIRKYNPPPNPAKQTDARFEGYRKKFGDESWELDALEPAVIDGLIRSEVDTVRDSDLWVESEARHQADLNTLDDMIENLGGR